MLVQGYLELLDITAGWDRCCRFGRGTVRFFSTPGFLGIQVAQNKPANNP